MSFPELDCTCPEPPISLSARRQKTFRGFFSLPDYETDLTTETQRHQETERKAFDSAVTLCLWGESTFHRLVIESASTFNQACRISSICARSSSRISRDERTCASSNLSRTMV